MKHVINFIVGVGIVYLVSIGFVHVINKIIDKHVEHQMKIDEEAVKQVHDRIMKKYEGILNKE